jgi:hypothetical protein
LQLDKPALDNLLLEKMPLEKLLLNKPALENLQMEKLPLGKLHSGQL